MNPTKFNLNSDVMTKLVRDVYLPAFETETWNNSGALSESFGMSGIGSSINATSGKLDAYFKKGSIGSVGAFGDDFTFESGSLKNIGVEAVIRTRGFQANAGISIIPSQRMSGPEAWENIFADNFTDLTTTLKRQYSRMLYGNGSGVITEVEATAPVTADFKGGFVDVKVKDIRAFRIGDLVSFAPGKKVDKDGADTAKVNKAGITYDEGTQTVTSQNRWATFGEGATVTTSYKIDDIDYAESIIVVFDTAEDGKTKLVASGSAADTEVIAANAKIYYNKSVGADIHGLDYIIRNSKSHLQSGSTTVFESGYFGLGEKVYGGGDGQRPRYLNSHITSVTNFLTEDAFMKHYEEIEMIGGTPADLMVTSRGTRRAIASTNQGATQSIVRLMRDASATAANDQRSLGYAGVDLKGEAIEIDRMAPSGKLWALKLDTFDMANEQELTFDDFDGQTWKQVRRGTDNKRVLAYEANMYGYRELFNKNPRNNGYIKIETPKIILPTMDPSKGADLAELGKDSGQGFVGTPATK